MCAKIATFGNCVSTSVRAFDFVKEGWWVSWNRFLRLGAWFFEAVLCCAGGEHAVFAVGYRGVSIDCYESVIGNYYEGDRSTFGNRGQESVGTGERTESESLASTETKEKRTLSRLKGDKRGASRTNLSKTTTNRPGSHKTGRLAAKTLGTLFDDSHIRGGSSE